MGPKPRQAPLVPHVRRPCGEGGPGNDFSFGAPGSMLVRTTFERSHVAMTGDPTVELKPVAAAQVARVRKTLMQAHGDGKNDEDIE